VELDRALGLLAEEREYESDPGIAVGGDLLENAIRAREFAKLDSGALVDLAGQFEDVSDAKQIPSSDRRRVLRSHTDEQIDQVDLERLRRDSRGR
jgi:hypothetical protein